MDYDTSLPAPQSIEQIRARLQHLTTSLQALHARLLSPASSASGLPSWSSIQSSLVVALSQLSTITTTLARAEEEARTVVVFPNNKFPTSAAEGLLATLLRTKPLPDAEAWVEDVMQSGEGLESLKPFRWPFRLIAQQRRGPEGMDIDAQDGDDVPDDEYSLQEWLTMQRDRRQWTGFYTKQEVDDAFEIDRDDLDDIRRARQQESDRALAEMRDMLRFARSGR